MLSQKVSKYSWRKCQPYDNCYNNVAVPKKQLSFWKVALSILAAFFVVFFVAKVLSSLGKKIEEPVEAKTVSGQSESIIQPIEQKVSLLNKILGIKTVQAASFSAKNITPTYAITMKAGETTTYTITFKNTGTASWSNSSPRFASVYTAKPDYRTSIFANSDWYKSNQPAKMKNSLVKPGELAIFDIILKAPAQPGVYKENFRLALENTAWLSGGDDTITITVVANNQNNQVAADAVRKTEVQTISSETTEEELPAAVTDLSYNSAAPDGVKGYSAQKMTQSHNSLEFINNSAVAVAVSFKNTGVVGWKNYGNEAVRLVAIDTTTQSFYDQSWLTNEQVALMKTKEAEKGETGEFTFNLLPPTKEGSFITNFQIKIGDNVVEGGDFSLPIKVQPTGVVPGKGMSVPASAGNAAVLGTEPIIRVGLYQAADPVVVISDYSYEVWQGPDKLLTTINAATPATLTYSSGQYTVISNGNTFTATEPVRLVSQNGVNGIFTLTNYENRPNWNLSLNYNQFRNIIELNNSSANGQTWVINALPIESYLRGLKESSQVSPFPYQQALVTAARSYAYYHYQRGTKYIKNNFTLHTTNDQVYRGYVAETILPKVSQAVDSTRGQVVTYNDVPVVTPYFSQSDGRTRSWSEAWGGADKAWLVSVSVPSDVNNSLWGHGVGMSCRAAINMANEGMTYDQILKYFYQGTGLRQLW